MGALSGSADAYYGALSGPPSPIRGSSAIAVGPNGDLYVGDQAGLVHEIRLDGTHVRTLTPPSTAAPVGAVAGLAVAADGDVIAYGTRVYAFRIDGTFAEGPREPSPCFPGSPHPPAAGFSGIVTTATRVLVGGACNAGAPLNRDLQPASGVSGLSGECFRRAGDRVYSQYFNYLGPSSTLTATSLDGSGGASAPALRAYGHACIARGDDGRFFVLSRDGDRPTPFFLSVYTADGTLLGELPETTPPAEVLGGRLYFTTGEADVRSTSAIPGLPSDERRLGGDPEAPSSADPDPNPAPAPDTDPPSDPVAPETDGCGLVFRAGLVGGLLNGSDEEDHLIGSDAADLMNGLSARDCLDGGRGNDRIYGQDGNDIVAAGEDNDYIHGMAGRDGLHGNAGHDLIFGGEDDDVLFGDDGNDREYGQDGDDRVEGGRGTDRLFGGDGNDIFNTGAGADIVHGQVGDDTAVGSDGNDTLYGETGRDTLSGGNGRDTLYGQEDDDQLLGELGSDVLDGEGGDDTLDGGDGADHVKGGSGSDVLSGGNGNDEIDAADGERDVVRCGAGRDAVVADQTDDVQDCERLTRVRAARVRLDCPLTAAVGCEGTLTVSGVDPAHFALSPGRHAIVVAAVRRPSVARTAAVRVKPARGSTKARVWARRATVR